MMEKNVHTFIGCDNDYEESKIVLFGAGYDGTTSYRPGTRFAGQSIRNESYGLESYSLYQDKDLLDYLIYDAGELELPFGGPERPLKQITDFTNRILSDEKIPFLIGGEHLVTLGAIRAVASKYKELHIIHFDAHADLREDYLGEGLSHACVMRRCHELVGDHRIFQFGIRSGDREEIKWGKEHVSTQYFNFEGLKQTIETLHNKPVYFTLDLDVLDPSVFPGTGTPEAGGVTFEELRKAIELVSQCNIVGLDVTELSPMYDQSGGSTAVACKIIRELLLYLGGK